MKYELRKYVFWGAGLVLFYFIIFLNKMCMTSGVAKVWVQLRNFMKNVQSRYLAKKKATFFAYTDQFQCMHTF